MKQKRKKLAKQSRWYRKMHRYIAVPLVLFMFVLGVTGLLLIWKDQLLLKPPSEKISFNNQTLISLDSVQSQAIKHIEGLQLDSEINRIDYRPSKGIAKVRFENHFTELQINCYTGEVISTKNRSSDVIEMIHDGSIIDFLFKSQSTPFKLIYGTITSLGLMLIAFSGFWLWLKPKQLKNKK